MRYLIYCDESDDKGRFYSNFYGGAILQLNEQKAIEARLDVAKGDFSGHEFKWTKIAPFSEAQYIVFVREIFSLIKEGRLKIRIMFTHNVNQTQGIEYDEAENKFFMLYYQFLKHAFGLQFCNTEYPAQSFISVALDDVPSTKQKFENFKNYLSSLSDYPIFFNARVCIQKKEIYAVNSKEHVILQAVDVILGAMQFRLNHKHKDKPPGSRVRAKRTMAKERVYNEIIASFEKSTRTLMSAFRPEKFSYQIAGRSNMLIGCSCPPAASKTCRRERASRV